jgi:hypothetical protein
MKENIRRELKVANPDASSSSSSGFAVERVQTSRPRNVLHWSPDGVRYHDVGGGRWIDYEPVSEMGAMIWCAANGVEFRKSPARPVSAADVIRSILQPGEFARSRRIGTEPNSSH